MNRGLYQRIPIAASAVICSSAVRRLAASSANALIITLGLLIRFLTTACTTETPLLMLHSSDYGRRAQANASLTGNLAVSKNSPQPDSAATGVMPGTKVTTGAQNAVF